MLTENDLLDIELRLQRGKSIPEDVGLLLAAYREARTAPDGDCPYSDGCHDVGEAFRRGQEAG